MTSQQLLDSVYLMPVVLDHINNPTKLTADILIENGISPDSVKDIYELRHLAQYHMEMVQNKFQPNYPLLRKGLREYFNKYLSGIWSKLRMLNRENELLIDYGCGEGQYGRKYKELNPLSDVFYMDRDLSPYNPDIVQINFEKEPNWYLTFTNAANVVLLSEVLHCKQPDLQEYLIKSSFNMLKDRGHLVIVENIDLCMQYRIAKLKGDYPYPILKEHDIYNLTKKYKLQLLDKHKINKHIVYDYRKYL